MPGDQAAASDLNREAVSRRLQSGLSQRKAPKIRHDPGIVVFGQNLLARPFRREGGPREGLLGVGH